MRRLLLCALLLALTGCAALPSIIKGVGMGAQYLASLIDVAEAGSDVYQARHPNADRDAEIDARIRQAKVALAALNAALSAADAAESEDVQRAKQEALTAYERMRELLDSLGVLDGKCVDCGGAETESPEPEPFELPPASEVAVRL